jgi:putative restriction endonuclease
MPALTNQVLFSKLRAALPPTVRFETAHDAIRPAVARVPGFGRCRFYLWTVTPDRSARGARPPGEFKIQLIVDGQGRGARGSIETAGATTALLGYSPDYGVFVGWEARIYSDFAYSANVQVRDALLAEARNTGWAVGQPRSIRNTTEVRVAFSPGNLLHFLRLSRQADADGLVGAWREAFFLSRIPNHPPAQMPARSSQLDTFIERERERLTATRLSRDSRFAPVVKEQFGHSCSLCRLQLEIVEAAHIIPIHEPRGRDQVWNGLALCPNHHRLFDARRFVIAEGLIVRVDFQALEFLRESGRAEGEKLLTDFHDREILRPHFWDGSPDNRARMTEALQYTAAIAAVA